MLGQKSSAKKEQNNPIKPTVDTPNPHVSACTNKPDHSAYATCSVHEQISHFSASGTWSPSRKQRKRKVGLQVQELDFASPLLLSASTLKSKFEFRGSGLSWLSLVMVHAKTTVIYAKSDVVGGRIARKRRRISFLTYPTRFVKSKVWGLMKGEVNTVLTRVHVKKPAPLNTKINSPPLTTRQIIDSSLSLQYEKQQGKYLQTDQTLFGGSGVSVFQIRVRKWVWNNQNFGRSNKTDELWIGCLMFGWILSKTLFLNYRWTKWKLFCKIYRVQQDRQI